MLTKLIVSTLLLTLSPLQSVRSWAGSLQPPTRGSQDNVPLLITDLHRLAVKLQNPATPDQELTKLEDKIGALLTDDPKLAFRFRNTKFDSPFMELAKKYLDQKAATVLAQRIPSMIARWSENDPALGEAYNHLKNSWSKWALCGMRNIAIMAASISIDAIISMCLGGIPSGVDNAEFEVSQQDLERALALRGMEEFFKQLSCESDLGA